MEENSGSQSASTKEGCRATVHRGPSVIPVPCPTATEDGHFKQVAQRYPRIPGPHFLSKKTVALWLRLNLKKIGKDSVEDDFPTNPF